MDKSPEDNFRRAIEDAKMATSRIPKEGIDGMNINSYIASLTGMARSSSSIQTQEERISLERTAGMYTYIRDNTGAQTIGEARKNLGERKIDEKVI